MIRKCTICRACHIFASQHLCWYCEIIKARKQAIEQMKERLENGRTVTADED